MYRLYTLGGLRIDGPDGAIGGRVAQRRPLSLLAVLAVGGEAGVPRDKIIGLLWPDKEDHQARHCLADTVYAVRHVLHEKAVRSTGGTLRLDSDLVWSDLGAFAEALARGAPADAIAFYRGPFLDGFHINGAIEFDHWADEQRRRLGRQLTVALDQLATAAEERSDFVGAARWLEIALEHEPYDSRLALRLAHALALAGDRGDALHALRRHEDRLREDLRLDPDPELLAGEAELRQAPVAEGTAGKEAERRWVTHQPLRRWLPATQALVPPLRLRRRARMWAAVVAAVAALTVAGVVWTQVDGAAELDPNRLVIPSFERVSDEVEDQLTHGIATLLELRLDGAGPLRVTSHSGRRGVADRRDAEQLARSVEAGLVLYGLLSPGGPDSVRLEAGLYDASLGAQVSRFEVTALAGRPDLLADSLAVQVLEELGRQRPFFPSYRLSSIGSTSSAAALAFVRGEWFLSRLQLDSATYYFERAISEDSAFALAYRGLAESHGWWNHVLGYLPDLLLRAGELNRGLAPRESLLITADSIVGAVHSYADVTPPDSLLGRLLLTLEDWSQAYPTDPEVWYRLGDVAWHWGGLIDLNVDSVRAWLSRAAVLGPEFAPQYVHLLEVYFIAGELDSALAVIERLLALEPSGAWADGPRLIADLLASDQSVRRAALQRVDSLATVVRDAVVPADVPTFTLYLAFYLTKRLADSAEINVAVGEAWRVAEALSLAHASRGHLARSYDWLSQSNADWYTSREGHFMALAYLEAISPDTVDRTVRRWLDARRARPIYQALRWWLERGDTLALKEAAALFDSVARAPVPATAQLGRYASSATRGYLALARGDSLTALDSLGKRRPWCWVSYCYHEALTAARVNEALGRYRAALSEYQRIPEPMVTMPSPEAAVIALERAHLRARLGHLDAALRDYEFVSAVWQQPDRALSRFVDEARAGARRVRVELSRRQSATGPYP
jgi:DNA-binding SARP family transcriptional activator